MLFLEQGDSTKTVSELKKFYTRQGYPENEHDEMIRDYQK